MMLVKVSSVPMSQTFLMHMSWKKRQLCRRVATLINPISMKISLLSSHGSMKRTGGADSFKKTADIYSRRHHQARPPNLRRDCLPWISTLFTNQDKDDAPSQAQYGREVNLRVLLLGKNTGDYHDMIVPQNFMRWVNKKFIPTFEARFREREEDDSCSW